MSLSDILSHDILIMPHPFAVSMHQHAVRTAMALYTGGTLDLETAARQAGVSTDRIERAARRLGTTPTPETTSRERHNVAAD
jgi:hypothetical protein